MLDRRNGLSWSLAVMLRWKERWSTASRSPASLVSMAKMRVALVDLVVEHVRAGAVGVLVVIFASKRFQTKGGPVTGRPL